MESPPRAERLPVRCTRMVRMPAGLPSSQCPKAKNQRRTQILHCFSNFPAAPINAANNKQPLICSVSLHTGGNDTAFLFSSQHRAPTTTFFFPKSPHKWAAADLPQLGKATAGSSSPTRPARRRRGFHPPLGASLLPVHRVLNLQDHKCHRLYSACGHEKAKAPWRACLFLIINPPSPSMPLPQTTK